MGHEERLEKIDAELLALSKENNPNEYELARMEVLEEEKSNLINEQFLALPEFAQRIPNICIYCRVERDRAGTWTEYRNFTEGAVHWAICPKCHREKMGLPTELSREDELVCEIIGALSELEHQNKKLAYGLIRTNLEV